MLGSRIWLLRAYCLLGIFLFLYGYGPKGGFSRKENLGLQAEREIKWGGELRERAAVAAAAAAAVMWPTDAGLLPVGRQ